MVKDIKLTNENLRDFWAFMVTSSRQARKSALFNTLGVFAEIMIAFFVLDLIFATNFLTPLGLVLATLWLVFYPKFLRKKQVKILKSVARNDEIKDMKFELNDENFAFFSGEKDEKSTFNFIDISEIYECKNIFIVFLFDKIHIILPKDDQTLLIVSNLAKNAKKNILKFENLAYDGVVLG
ncbi:hypothetical protein [Campylobacter gastrosuis]|uniref:YcxB-like protein domain-containing protein n=1 Tax=Campylobacter gastrosuis TaxID=2974576 RepID=A0ABT7HNF8_9BACT|nr:hypothetical protein [Campylobacter gastrosuis]MDL0088467.1 hypothetical protein [Campylobacter gastrosuis]